MAKKPSPKPEATWKKSSAPRTRRKGNSGSVALAILNQAPQTRSGTAAGKMTPMGVDPQAPPVPTSVKPPPATGIGDPDRQPQSPLTAPKTARTKKPLRDPRRR